VLQVILVGYFGLMSRICAIKLNLCQSFKIVVAAINAKAAFVIEQFVWGVKTETTVKAFIDRTVTRRIHYYYLPSIEISINCNASLG
jgi:hypothetical protein